MEDEIGEMCGVGLTSVVYKFGQATATGFSLGQRRGGDVREVENAIKGKFSKARFGVLHLTFQGVNRATFDGSKIGIKYPNELGIVFSI